MMNKHLADLVGERNIPAGLKALYAEGQTDFNKVTVIRAELQQMFGLLKKLNATKTFSVQKKRENKAKLTRLNKEITAKEEKVQKLHKAAAERQRFISLAETELYARHVEIMVGETLMQGGDAVEMTPELLTAICGSGLVLIDVSTDGTPVWQQPNPLQVGSAGFEKQLVSATEPTLLKTVSKLRFTFFTNRDQSFKAYSESHGAEVTGLHQDTSVSSTGDAQADLLNTDISDFDDGGDKPNEFARVYVTPAVLDYPATKNAADLLDLGDVAKEVSMAGGMLDSAGDETYALPGDTVSWDEISDVPYVPSSDLALQAALDDTGPVEVISNTQVETNHIAEDKAKEVLAVVGRC